MKLTIIIAALSAFDMTDAHPPQTLGAEIGDLASSESVHALQKRDAYTCYGSSNATLSDCEKVIATIRAHGEEVFSLRSGLCLVWSEGSCGVRFCAVRYVRYPLNRTASWVADYLTSPLLEDCVGAGANGIMGDSHNINSQIGTYRLSIAEYFGDD
ncbi:hypothetical protein DL766_001099 [Monosporascus sp. MC13-8B]|uniref:Ecp2 effector protein domain-containing protein n=1 Tax=Monosporascus cannonballus TaxID=155416 RepID=A0ABY0H7G8_9PEZI|nr:hypothetical protein DL763_008877 [Monosporascus cannonballus]RYO86880.1 hypothetical protein DL762_004544 [Monosporascus cannonballus]RYP38189.1 hypothetical protein DL766_001099 [Monosporascus sp. MC13-8B]